MAGRYNGSENSIPPRPLGKAGKDLWDRINMDFVLADETERETLCQICEAQDHAAELCETIKAGSPIIETNTGDKAHPAYLVVRQYRSFILRSLEKLKSHHNRASKVMVGRPARTTMGYDPWEEKS
jgi:hypothetical protein